MKKIILFTALAAIGFQLSAQLKFFAETSMNLTLISNSERTYTTKLTSDRPGYEKYQIDAYRAEYKKQIGGNIMLGAQYFFNPQVSLESGIDINLVDFNQKLKSATGYYHYTGIATSTDISQGATPPTFQMSQNNFKLLYLNVPFSAFYHLFEDKLAIGLGVIPGYLVSVSGGNKSEVSLFNKSSFGMQVQLRYQFVNRCWISGAFQDFNTKLYDAALKQSFSSNRLIKLGLRYDF